MIWAVSINHIMQTSNLILHGNSTNSFIALCHILSFYVLYISVVKRLRRYRRSSLAGTNLSFWIDNCVRKRWEVPMITHWEVQQNTLQRKRFLVSRGVLIGQMFFCQDEYCGRGLSEGEIGIRRPLCAEFTYRGSVLWVYARHLEIIFQLLRWKSLNEGCREEGEWKQGTRAGRKHYKSWCSGGVRGIVWGALWRMIVGKLGLSLQKGKASLIDWGVLPKASCPKVFLKHLTNVLFIFWEASHLK